MDKEKTFNVSFFETNVIKKENLKKSLIAARCQEINPTHVEKILSEFDDFDIELLPYLLDLLYFTSSINRRYLTQDLVIKFLNVKFLPKEKHELIRVAQSFFEKYLYPESIAILEYTLKCYPENSSDINKNLMYAYFADGDILLAQEIYKSLGFKKNSTALKNSKKTVFINSIGGFGDSQCIPYIIEVFKREHPDHYIILYDSMRFFNYYEKPNFIDEIIPANLNIFPIHQNYAPYCIENEIQENNIHKKTLLDIDYDYIVNTHHNHGRILNSRLSDNLNVNNNQDSSLVYLSDTTLDVDMDQYYDKILSNPYEWFRPQLKETHIQAINDHSRKFNPQGKLTIAISVRSKSPYGNHYLKGPEFVEFIDQLAIFLTNKYDAVIYTFGDDRLPTNNYYKNEMWFDLNEKLQNAYYIQEFVAKSDIFLMGVSGFSFIAKFLRSPDMLPTIPLLPYVQSFEKKQYNWAYQMLTFGHPSLEMFLSGIKVDIEYYSEFIDYLLGEYKINTTNSA